jgi:hypothetical protein
MIRRKEAMSHSLVGIGYVLALSWLIGSGTAAADPILLPVQVQVAVGGTPITGDTFATAEYDATDSLTGGSTLLHALASAGGPVVDILGEGTHGFGFNRGSFYAQAVYQFVVMGDPALGPVPIDITGAVEADASAGTAGGGFAEAYLSSGIPLLTGGSYLLLAQQCAEIFALCTGAPSSAEGTVIALATPRTVYNMNVYADAAGGGDSWNVDAVADPIIQVSDAFIPHTTLRYSDVFSLELSPGVVQGLGETPTVPEPASLMLLGTGVLTLVGRHVRRRRHA